MAELYKYARGWVGMSHEQAMSDPLASIYLALQGRVDFVTRTNPFGGGGGKPGGGAPVSAQLRAWIAERESKGMVIRG